MRRIVVAGLCLGLLGAAAPAAAEAYYGPSPYLSFADSPFASITFQQFILQEFDSAGLDTTTVSAGGVWLNFGSLIDSVGGGGAVPGSWYSNGLTSITFDFTAYFGLYGMFPTHAGIVWTDVGYQDGESPPGPFSGVGEVVFTGTDADGNGFAGIGATLGDGAADGGTAEDRFFGVSNAGGIRSITISMPTSGDWEVDHLQYGSMVPEPAAWAMLVAGFGLVGGAARRRRSELRAFA